MTELTLQWWSQSEEPLLSFSSSVADAYISQDKILEKVASSPHPVVCLRKRDSVHDRSLVVHFRDR